MAAPALSTTDGPDIATDGPGIATEGPDLTDSPTDGPDLTDSPTDGPDLTDSTTDGPDGADFTTGEPDTTDTGTDGPVGTGSGVDEPGRTDSATDGPDVTDSATDAPDVNDVNDSATDAPDVNDSAAGGAGITDSLSDPEDEPSDDKWPCRSVAAAAPTGRTSSSAGASAPLSSFTQTFASDGSCPWFASSEADTSSLSDNSADVCFSSLSLSSPTERPDEGLVNRMGLSERHRCDVIRIAGVTR